MGQAPTSCLKLPLACLTWAQLLVTLAAFQGVFLQLPTQHTPRGLGTPLGHMAGRRVLLRRAWRPLMTYVVEDFKMGPLCGVSWACGSTRLRQERPLEGGAHRGPRGWSAGEKGP